MARKIEGPWVIVANRLTDGRAVYFARGGRWAERSSRALLITDETVRDEIVAEAMDAETDNVIVAPEAIAATKVDKRPAPVRLREQIRAGGPTVSPFDAPVPGER